MVLAWFWQSFVRKQYPYTKGGSSRNGPFLRVSLRDHWLNQRRMAFLIPFLKFPRLFLTLFVSRNGNRMSGFLFLPGKSKLDSICLMLLRRRGKTRPAQKRRARLKNTSARARDKPRCSICIIARPARCSGPFHYSGFVVCFIFPSAAVFRSRSDK